MLCEVDEIDLKTRVDARFGAWDGPRVKDV